VQNCLDYQNKNEFDEALSQFSNSATVAEKRRFERPIAKKKLGATSCSLEMWMEKLWLKHAETTKFLFCRALATEVGSPLRSQPRLTQKEAQELEKMTRPPVPQPLEYATSPLRQSNMSVEHHLSLIPI
jgi:hypothetical protein